MSPGGQAGEAQRLRGMVLGYRSTSLLYVLVKSGLAEAMAAGPRAADDLASALGLHAPSVLRLMRGLVVLGVVESRPDGAFGLTSMGRMLVPPGIAAAEVVVSVESHLPGWAGLLHSLRTGEVAFDAAMGMSVWDHRSRSPGLNRSFNEWMAGHTEHVAPFVAEALDPPSGGLVADIGGGDGTLLAAILARHPVCRGVLLEQPALAEAAAGIFAAKGLAGRARFVAGDLFRPFGLQADVVLLKSVLHNWDDARCVDILRRAREALLPGGTVRLVERLLPDGQAVDPVATFLDLQMLAVTGGCERTLAGYGELLGRAGLALSAVRATPPGLAVLTASAA